MIRKARDRPGLRLLLTGEARVLAYVAREPEARVREIAAATGLSERTVQRMTSDLEAAGYLKRIPVWNYNRYEVVHDAQLADDISGTVSDLLALVGQIGN